MNLLSNPVKTAMLLLGLYLTGCRPESLLLSPAGEVMIEEKGLILNTDRLHFQLTNDSIGFIQNENTGLCKFNLASGKVLQRFTVHDSVRITTLKEMIDCFPEKYIYPNQDSLIKTRGFDDINTHVYIAGFYYYKDTLTVLCMYTFIGHYGVNISNKVITGFVYDNFPVLIKADRNMAVISCRSLYQDTAQAKQLNFAGTFTRLNSTYYFPNMITYIYINPEGTQLRVYDEINGRLKPARSGSWTLPLSEELVKKMGYADTTTRNNGKGKFFVYGMKTLNEHAYFCNNYQLVDITANKTIFDGIENDFKIDAYAVDDEMNYYILARDGSTGSVFSSGQGSSQVEGEKNKYSLKVFDRNIQLIKEQDVPIEKGEHVINSDMKENKLVLIIEKNEKLYFKIFTINL